MPPASRTPPATPPEPRSPLDLKPSNLWLLTLALVALFGMRDLWITSNQVEPIPYSEFLKQLKAGQIESVRPGEDRYLASRGELRNRLAMLLGGRAAEALVLGEISTGAADDLGKATDIARRAAAIPGPASATAGSRWARSVSASCSR